MGEKQFYAWLLRYAGCKSQEDVLRLLQKTFDGRFGLVLKHFFFENGSFEHGATKFLEKPNDYVVEIGHQARIRRYDPRRAVLAVRAVSIETLLHVAVSVSVVLGIAWLVVEVLR